jgi:LysR family transcriptional regulator, glycine cleavage system transcriptional activator
MQKLPPLVELRAFEAAARHMSFKKASDELGVTPTAISHQVRLLERFCGQALFRRHPRPLALTGAGAKLFPIVREGLEAFAKTIAVIREGTDKQPLRITTTNAFASRWLIPRLPAWHKTHRNAPLEVIGTDSVLNLREGEADVAIRYAHRPPTGMVCRELFRDTFWPVCSPRLLPSGRPLRHPSALATNTLIHCYWPASDLEAPTWQRYLAALRAKWSDVPGFEQVNHLSFREELHAIEAVIAGQGIGVCSDILVARELAAGTLVKCLNLSLPGYGFYLTSLSDHPRQRTIKAFSEWMLANR